MASHKRSRGFRYAALGAGAATAAAVTLIATPFAGAAAPAEGTVYGLGAPGAISGSYVVILDESADKAKLANKYGGELQRSYGSQVNGFSASGLSETEAKRLAADPAVGKVVQNKKFTIKASQPNPPSWGLDRIDQTAQEGDKKYDYPDKAGEGVTAYVIDTGIRVTHEDFGGRATHGFDAVDNDDSADDGNGHGTHVAGTVAGTAHGVAKKAKLVAVRVLDDNGSGTTEQVVAGIDWVTKNHSGPSVANMSLGGGADEALDEAVRRAVAAGVAFSVAAGNESSDAGQGSPSRVTEALTVASSTIDDAQSSFSNFGSVVDLYAPGSDITSAWNDSDTGTKTISGTSMAAPHVAGAAALYLSGHPSSTPAQTAAALTAAATAGAVTNPSTGTANKLLKVAP
ncbi:S8 family serine peptidase [Streptomyces sp. NPDC054904]|uniref:S8 family peptidase n=1 Tax=unclassified Streptomyces TaxID=2593676 RepID=UPI002481EABD|nr:MULTISPECIES: S8 family peptidase [unclassified Streptomyces]MDA5281313.1 S8 family serine peptidase [Streptomyces sp. Isolate_45]MDX2392391.1 S8 family peptidase [Streptomyces sp. DK15]